MLYTNKLVKNFISYKVFSEIISNEKFSSILLKIGGERCPPCKALDNGPLEELNLILNEELSKINKNNILIFNCDLENPELYNLIINLNFSVPKSIPAFYLFLPNEKNFLNFIFSSFGYDVSYPKKWLSDFSSLILEKICK